MINNIQEDYCSFEISKLLKEKGLRLNNTKEYFTDGTTSESIDNREKFMEAVNKKKVIASNVFYVTHALAIKWIRKNFGIHIEVYKTRHGNFSWLCDEHNSDIPIYQLPEEATEAALKYVLSNLI